MIFFYFLPPLTTIKVFLSSFFPVWKIRVRSYLSTKHPFDGPIYLQTTLLKQHFKIHFLFSRSEFLSVVSKSVVCRFIVDELTCAQPGSYSFYIGEAVL